ncbi:RepB family plasmid replication initiator protein [Acinetobacter baumannii]|uniref:RepB family plasmid replication initiator protein n=1 Tax=Acinetobacter baumannii TaxID=470 RepID=UPI0024B7577C|nr:RepB family plasmid replication initiator protein [Acinetobacter baumannii]MDI9761127.1 RepB family plasmid replication initiator protein [Acinetobacter baumannii]
MSAPVDKRYSGNELVVKDLGFMQSAYSLDVVELRLVAMAIIELRQDSDRANFDPNVPVTIHANTYAKLFDTSRQNAYMVLESAAKSLRDRLINSVDIYEDKKNGKKAQRMNDLRWTSQCSYVPSLGLVQLYFSPQIIPFLVHLDKNFAGYEIRNLIKLTTPYEIRLYELGVAWKKTGVAKFNKETLRQRLGILDESQFKTASNFNRMLNKSLDTINNETDLTISFTPNYERNEGSKGRHVSSYTMSVKVKKGQFIPKPLKAGEGEPENNAAFAPSAPIDSENQMRTVNPEDETAFLNGLGQSDSVLRFDESESVEFTERPIKNKSTAPQATLDFGEEFSAPAKVTNKKNYGIVFFDNGIIQAWPNEDGSWDCAGILEHLEKPLFQIIGMKQDSIPDELVIGTKEYQKHKDNETLAKVISKSVIMKKVGTPLKRGKASASSTDEAVKAKRTHKHTYLTESQIKSVMSNVGFVSKYAPVGNHSESVVRTHLMNLLTGDLQKIPDLDDYLPYRSVK